MLIQETTQSLLQERRDYTAPEAEQMSLEKPISSLLMTLSGDIEAWEDDEELTEEPFSI